MFDKHGDSKVIEHVTQKNSYANIFRSSSIMRKAAGLNITLPTLRSVVHNRKSLAEPAIYGMALIASMVAAFVTIWTVSSISQIGSLVWLLIGAGVAFGTVELRQTGHANVPHSLVSNWKLSLRA